MANRCLLHKSKLEDFSNWLVSEGWVLESPKGDYEVLRAKRGKDLLLLYKGKSSEHYSILDKDSKVVRKYIKQSKKLCD